MKTNVKNLRLLGNAHPKRNTGLHRKVLPMLIAGCFTCGQAWANPTGAQVVNGQVGISNNGNVLTVTNSPGSIINWQSFSINPGELTQFLQQSATSSVLNRIVGQNPSQILGALQSNGKVYLINPNGILFGSDSRVDVGGLVASSLDISNGDFTNGKLNFNGVAQAGAVTNQGAITTPSGGSVYLIAPQVQNSGIVTSPQGEVLLAAGHSVQLVEGGDPNVQVVISAPTDSALNLGNVVAQGGKIGIYGALVNQNGIVSADSAVVGQNGEIVFKSSQTTMLAGNSKTSATGAGTGGNVYLLGPQVGLTDNAQIDASGQTGGGTVLVGGGFHGTNAAVENATATYVGPNTLIKADAIQNGNGGNVAVWSNQQTRMYGTISAQGGAQGGDGGFVETSSKNYLDFQGSVDLLAANGVAGTLLLDPSDIVIQSGSSSGTSGSTPFTGTDGQTSFLSVSTLNAALANGSVVVDATPGSTPPPLSGTITVGAPIAWSSGNTLTLNAAQDIYVNSSIIATDISAIPNGVLLLQAGRNITQSIGSQIIVGSLAATATTGAVTLTETTNNVTGSIAGSGPLGFSFTNSGAITVDTVNSVAGITSNNGSIGLTALGGDITQTSVGPIVGLALSAVASGNVTLTNTSNGLNTVGTIAGSAGGASGFAFANSGNLSVNSVTYNTSPMAANYPTLSSSTQAGIASTAGPINLNVTGNIVIQDTVNGITAYDNSSTYFPVTLTSINGSVTTAIGGAPITGSSLTLSAYSGVGTTSGTAVPLSTAVSSLQVTNGSGGDIYISNTGPLTITGTGVTQSSGGNIYIAADSDITVGSAINTGSSGDVGLSSGGNIAVNAPITAFGTVALLTTGGNITQDGNGAGTASIGAASLSAVASGNVALNDLTNAIGTIAGSSGGSSGFLFQNSTSFSVGNVPAVGGSLSTGSFISSATGIGAGSLYPVYLASTNGSINSANSATISGDSLQISAATGIGSLEFPLLTSVGSLQATNTTSSDIFVSNTTGQPLTIADIGTLGYGIQQFNGGNVSISADGGITVNAAITAATGTVALTASAGDITQASASITATSVSAVATTGSVDLSASNAIQTIGGSAVSGFFVENENSISVGSITATAGSISVQTLNTGNITINGPINASGGVSLGATGGSIIQSSSNAITANGLSLNAGINVGSSGTPVLTNLTGTTVLHGGSLGGDFYVNNSSDALYLGSIIATGAVVVNTTGTLTMDTSAAPSFSGNFVAGFQNAVPHEHFGVNDTFISGSSVTLTSLGDMYIGTGNDITATGAVSLYAGYATAGGSATAASSLGINGSLSGSAYNVYAGGAITNYSTVFGTYGGSGNNVLQNQFAVTPPPPPQPTVTALTVTGETAGNKVYDGTTVDTLNGGTLVGTESGVTLVQSGNFASSNVGSGIAVTATDSLTGPNANLYTLIEPTGLFANITQAPLTVSGQTAGNKVYNGNTIALLTSGNLVGLVAGDAVTLNSAGSFVSKNVGTGIAVTATDSLSGASAGNYVLTQPTLAANITPAMLTVSGETAANKVYDGTTAATLTGGSLSGAVAGDAATLALTQAGNFASKNVGAGIAVTAADGVSGASAGNYTLVQPVVAAANITPATLTVSGETAANKVYDGTTAATLVGGTLTGVVAGDAATLALTQAGNFASKNVGAGIAVTAADGVSGASAGNYTLVQPVVVAANITPAALTVSGEIAANKVYDGTTTATLIGGSLTGAVAGDAATLALTQAGSFASANAGTGIAVVAADSVSGASTGNYTLAQPVGLTANITVPATTVVSQSQSQSEPQTAPIFNAFIAPLIQAANTNVGALLVSSSSSQGGGTQPSGTSSNSGTTNTGATNNDTAKKLYCN
jgi:filamentous hemagglutinin family protein